jgi:hypothetical protein
MQSKTEHGYIQMLGQSNVCNILACQSSRIKGAGVWMNITLKYNITLLKQGK